MTSGPTAGATERAVDGKRWETKPRTARAVRWSILLMPSVVALVVTFWISTAVPPERLGLAELWYLALLVFVGLLLVANLERVARRFLPLEALFRLSLVFPDAAPSRFQLLLRGGNPKTIAKLLDEVEAGERPALDDQAYLEMMLTLVNSLQTHDRMTRGHSERVRGYSETIGVELGLTDAELDKLRWAALLHDVGKLRVPVEILNKDGRPDEDEWKILSSHPAEGGDIAAPLKDWLGPWFSAIVHHHERFDGTGYPDRLSGTDIHISGRIVAVADAYDVMTSTRSYKKPLSHSAARAELTKNSGTQFDPVAVRALLRTAVPAARWNFGWLVALFNRPGLHVGASSLSTAAVVVTSAATGVLGVDPSPATDLDALAFAQEEVLAPTSTIVVSRDDGTVTTVSLPDTTTTSSTTSSTSSTTSSTTTPSTTTTSVAQTTTPVPATRAPTPTTSPPTTAPPTTVPPTTVAPTTSTTTSTTTTSTTTTSTTTTSTTTTTVSVGTPEPSFTFADNGLGRVWFTNMTTGDQPMSFVWDFGDGVTSTQQMVNHQYQVEGDYVVTLTATNVLGTASVSETITISNVLIAQA